ncbi:biotin/lipoyl-containing protein [Ornithinimicrobium sp. INDO-MA30-4]|uniref:biotin/lipoyl-containing protein n=1 Tax=Ornithinimicrobium sp. INDO-MA30-4 TaxID=2908651 RepID=UPI001F3EAD4D|nr:biotin/lipoyl-containing protein [Ornithinimicrobium sp. INDO-MA30-4]UJH70925.1 hypothetical protein L0A91_02875 [Ornithinimicrobium sp. INDO-MA30-4]
MLQHVVAVGDTVAPGDVIGRIEGRRDVHEVKALHPGHVTEWLAEPGDPVAPGQPLLRLHPTEDSE